jgi:hypothetical protein
MELPEGTAVLSESDMRMRLTNAERVIQYATDVGDHNMKWKDLLAALWYQKGTPVNLTIMDELEQLDWKKIRDAKIEKRFQFQLTYHGRKKLLDDPQPEALLLRHVKFIMDNYEGMDSVTTWTELRYFDSHSRIHRVNSRKTTPDDGVPMSNIVMKPSRRSGGSQSTVIYNNYSQGSTLSADQRTES